MEVDNYKPTFRVIATCEYSPLGLEMALNDYTQAGYEVSRIIPDPKHGTLIIMMLSSGPMSTRPATWDAAHEGWSIRP